MQREVFIRGIKHKAVSRTTIKRCTEYLCDSFLTDSAVRYDIKGKKYIDTPVKHYFTDLGLGNASLNFRQFEETHATENVIFRELCVMKRGICNEGIAAAEAVQKIGCHTLIVDTSEFRRNDGGLSCLSPGF